MALAFSYLYISVFLILSIIRKHCLFFTALTKFQLLQLLCMKRGGELIYAGPLGPKSSELISYFEVSWCTLSSY